MGGEFPAHCFFIYSDIKVVTYHRKQKEFA